MKLKELRRRFRSWQQEPYHYSAPAEEHRCNNCGHSFKGDFCPVCGQKARIGLVSWKSVWEDFLSVWVSDSRSAFPSFLQLMGRPGYLIHDYISGKRKVCYSPVSMLFLLAILVALATSLTSGKAEADLEVSGDGSQMIYWVVDAIVWLHNHPAWYFLLCTAFMLIPTRMLFRYAPRHSRHSLPEGIYIQIFMSCVMAIISVISSFWDALAVFYIIYYVIAYKQLFGFDLWGSFWRVIFCMTSALVMALLVISLGVVITYYYMSDESLLGPVLAVVICFGVQLLILFLFGRIGKGRYQKSLS